MVKISASKGFGALVFSSVFGAVLEWYDFILYGVLSALVFNKLFFPHEDPRVGTLLAFTTFAIGFLARPIGGYVLGRLGDRIGRKPVLIITMLIIGVSTGLMGCMPTYASIGVWAAFFLVLLRLVQGFALGGEFGGAVILVTETSAPEQRGWWASWPQAGGPAGVLLAVGTLSILSLFTNHEQFLAWGWRVPFFVSIIIACWGLWMRHGVEESPIYREAAQKAKGTLQEPAWKVFEHPGPLLRAWGVRLLENTAFYLFGIFVVSYATSEAVGFSRAVALHVATLGAAFQLVSILVGGWLSDLVGRKPVMLFASIGLMIWAPIFFYLVDSHSMMALYLAVVVGLTLHGLLAGPEAAWLIELFPTRHRYIGASLAFQGSSIFAGGPAPLIASALLILSGSTWPIVGYIILCGIVALIALALSNETFKSDLRNNG